MARPVVDIEDKKDVLIAFRCTKKQYLEFNNFEKENNLSKLETHLLAIGKKLPIKKAASDEKLLDHLSRIGNNLNQLAKALNSGSLASRLAARSKLSVIKEIQEMIKGIQLKLL